MTPPRAASTPLSNEDLRQLTRALNRLSRLRRWVGLGECLLQALVLITIAALTLFVFDNLVQLSDSGRAAAFALLLAAGIVGLSRIVAAARRRWNQDQLALMVERQYPELDNRLVNAVQFGAQDAAAPGHKLIQSLIREAAQRIRSLDLCTVIPKQGLKRGTLVVLVLVPLVAIYPLFFPDHFFNAAVRVLLPTAPVLPISQVRLKIEPGDATLEKGSDLTVLATPLRGLPRTVTLELNAANLADRFTMGLDGDRFVYSLREMVEPFRYRVRAGDFRSTWYRVDLIERPTVTSMAARHAYPPYTRLAPELVDPADGHLAALTGTRVTLTARTNKPLRTADLRPRRGTAPATQIAPDGLSVETALTVRQDDTYHWFLVDREGFDNDPAPTYTIRPLGDEDPIVVITSPRQDVGIPRGEALGILYRARDDYGVARIEVSLTRNSQVELLDASDLDPPPTTVNEGYVLPTAHLTPGDEFQIRVQVTDTDPITPGVAISEPLTVHITEPVKPENETAARLERILDALLQLLNIQQGLRADTGKWRASLTNEEITARQRQAGLRRTTLGQSMLRADAVALSSLEWAEPGWTRMAVALRELTEGLMRKAVALLRELTEMRALKPQFDQTLAVHATQTEIMRRLEELIGQLADAHPQLKQSEQWRQFDQERTRRGGPESLDNLHGGVLEFIGDQDSLVRSLQRMEDVHPDDLSTTQVQQIEDLAEIEEAWAEYFKDAADWLRETPMVDGTESGLRDELIEIYSEIEPLPEELRSKTVTIEVTREEVGLALAMELLEDLEKWLAEEPDFMKWVLEEPLEPYDVPLAELPDELEDIIGDLIESEEMMSAEIEDVTSNWADSLGEIGWGGADGPISNYSAKGITGNILPNDMDIAGRSGEGRSGRALGEMVESVATGKGGRQTPTRITGDPMGDGVVEDLSTDPAGGATGGGKLAGTTGWGLVAPNAPPQPEMLETFARRQTDLRMEAMSLEENLMGRGLPSGGLARSIEGMRRVEKALQNGVYDNLRDLNTRVLSDLKDQRRLVREHFRMRRDPSWRAQSKRRHQIRQVAPESFPEGYQALLSAYFEALASQVDQ